MLLSPANHPIFIKKGLRAMVSIFDYDDFQEYLKAYYTEQRELHDYFSYEWLARKAGFPNRGFIYNIINKPGTRLSANHCVRLSEALNHSNKETEYFTYIVAYAQESDENNRIGLKKKIDYIRKVVKTDLIRKDQKAFFSKWYHSVIRSLIGIIPFKGDFVQLSRMLFPPITPEQAKESIELLERLQIIERENDGTYVFKTEKILCNNSDFTQAEKDRYHFDCMKAAKDAMQYHFPEQQVRSLTFGISEKTYRIIQQETIELMTHVKKLIENDNGADRVFLLQSIMVPLTKKTL